MPTDDLDFQLEEQFGDQQGPAAPPPQPAAVTPTGAAFGQRGFNYQRARPGDVASWSQKINPRTQRPYTSYQEYAEVEMPDAFAGSQVGQGLRTAPPLPPPNFSRGAQAAFRPPPLPQREGGY